jgi:hypothetical protein
MIMSLSSEMAVLQAPIKRPRAAPRSSHQLG